MSSVKIAVKNVANYEEFMTLQRRDSAGKIVPFNVSGYTITLNLYHLNRITTLVSSIPVSIVDAVNGQVKWLVTNAQVAQDGEFLGRLFFEKGTEKFFGLDEFTWLVFDNKV